MEIKDSLLTLGYHSLNSNYGYYIDKVSQNVLDELKVQINELQTDFSKGEKYNDQLVGQIQHEYKIVQRPQTKEYIKGLTQAFEEESRYITSIFEQNVHFNLSMKEMWVNFQKKHEYNPQHIHKSILSYVIWYQIPYLNEDEKKYNYNKECVHGNFYFTVPNTIFSSVIHSRIDHLKNYHLGIDKTKEGYIAIFPANLNHGVYPFYSSNDYRITISGNIEINQNQNQY
tara:strand:+ start:9 stop:692 length:684 start_codon:yes stop_codon:yes gene_type:complete